MDGTRFLYALIIGILPPLLWLWFWLKEDNLHPEPRAVLAKCFFYGMLGVFVAVCAQWLTSSLFPDNIHRYIVWAGIEEIVKFGIVYVVVIAEGKMDEPIDAMIYMITAALGFAALENTLFTLGAVNQGTIFSTILIGNMRFIGAILVHVISSAMIGFMLAISMYGQKVLKIIAGIVGLILATALHAAFNLSIISSETSSILKILAWVWVAVVVLILIFEEIKGIEINEDAKRAKLKQQ